MFKFPIVLKLKSRGSKYHRILTPSQATGIQSLTTATRITHIKPPEITPDFFRLASRWLAFRCQTEANGTLNATQQATNRSPTGIPLRKNTLFAGIVLSGISPIV